MKTNFTTELAVKYFGFLFLAAIVFQGCYVQQPVQQSYPVVQAPPTPPPMPPPAWAPPYQNPQVQYYYLPDIEVYYDVWSHEYVYMENGNWLFSSYLPPMYGNYDLYAGHVVILDYRVHQPWMHHEMYVSHYPRYYHQSGNPGADGYSTGYDENSNHHYYGPRNNPGSSSNGPRSSPNENNGPRSNSQAPNEPRKVEPRNVNEHPINSVPVNEPHTNSVPPRQENIRLIEPVRTNPAPKETNSTPRKQPVEYKGKEVGQPVKVNKNMQKPPQQKDVKKK